MLERVSSKERGEGLGHPESVLQVKQVGRAGKLEGLDVREPGEKQLASLVERRSAVLAEDGQHGLREAARILPRERPLLQGRQLLAEERVRVGDGLLEDAREPKVERAAVVRPEHAAEERVDCTLLVACAIPSSRRVPFGWTVNQQRKWLTSMLESESLGPS